MDPWDDRSLRHLGDCTRGMISSLSACGTVKDMGNDDCEIVRDVVSQYYNVLCRKSQ